MMRLSTPLALIAAHVLSWTGGPMYKCVHSNGDACIDAGPRYCGCCEASELAVACEAPPGGNCTGLDAAPHQELAFAAGESCDCSHELIPSDPPTLLLRASKLLSDQHALAAAAACSAASMADAWRQLGCGTIGGPPAGAVSAFLALHSIVIRC